MKNDLYLIDLIYKNEYSIYIPIYGKYMERTNEKNPFPLAEKQGDRAKYLRKVTYDNAR